MLGYGTVYCGSTAIVLARILDENTAKPLKSSDVQEIKFSVSKYVNWQSSPINGFESVSLDPGDVFYDDLQLNEFWSSDRIGYNFKHVIDISGGSPFEVTGQYMLEYRIKPLNGQPVVMKVLLQCV